MKFHLEFPIQSFPTKISYTDSLLFMGSCFAENIGHKMQSCKFNASINPNGILYNPVSISNALQSYLDNVQLVERDLFFANECWNSWNHHSRFSQMDKELTLKGINTSRGAANKQLENAQWLFITFGSAFVYELKSIGKIVGNCHKISQNEFEKKLLQVDEIVREYDSLIDKIKKINPTIQIVFTVSPVRYIRDGVVENNLSKSILIQSVHEIIKKHSSTVYFPAFEILMDDLRDYRFYENDLLHPNELAIDYIFDKWKTTAFEKNTFQLFEQLKEIKIAFAHKSFQENSDSNKKFKATFLKRCVDLKTQYPFLDLQKEIEYFS